MYLEHVNMTVANVDRSADFYRDLLGLERLTVKCIVPAASEVGAAFVCIYGTERIADTLDKPFDGSRGDTA